MVSKSRVRVYGYVGVQEDLYEAMMTAPSIGSFYSANIKNGANKGTANGQSVPFDHWPSYKEAEDATGVSFIARRKKARRASSKRFKNLPRIGDLNW